MLESKNGKKGCGEGDGLLGVARVNVLGVGVSALNMDEAVELLLDARAHGQTGYVCVTGVHGVIESQRDSELKQIHNNSLLTVPDGMPTVWMGHLQGFEHMRRVYGPDLMLAICERTVKLGQGAVRDDLAKHQQRSAEGKCMTHFLYGATEELLEKLKVNLESRFSGIQIGGTYAPPFRPLTDGEELELKEIVSKCKPDFFWVGLSTPKQEKFMASHLLLDCGIMLGVGAAFDFHAGGLKDAPAWIKNLGLQWFYRLCQEPRRLWRRYADIVPRFLFMSTMQLLGIKKYDMQ